MTTEANGFFRLMLPKIPVTTNFIEFYKEFMLPNLPCMLSSDWTVGWRSRSEFLNSDGTTPNLAFLRSTFGSATVPIVSNDAYENSECSEMKFEAFLEKLEETTVYLKDWHFAKAFPEYKAYALPSILASDWMNEYWDWKADPIQQDYRFLYFGPKGSWTPFHADVLRSYSWSANICGRKLWYLVPPDISLNVKNDIRELGNDEYLRNKGVLVVVQEAGEIIFVPSNWFHQVHNMEATISVNHNWFNSANISNVFEYCIERLKAVEREIADVKSLMSDQEWKAECQSILKIPFGIAFECLG